MILTPGMTRHNQRALAAGYRNSCSAVEQELLHGKGTNSIASRALFECVTAPPLRVCFDE